MEQKLIDKVTQKKSLTLSQEIFLNALVETDFDFEAAKEIAGYSPKSSIHSIVSRLKDQINELIEMAITMEAAKSVSVLTNIRDSEKHIVDAATKAQIANGFLEKAGHGRKDTLKVDHEIRHGIFILPAKEEVVIEQEEAVTESTG